MNEDVLDSIFENIFVDRRTEDERLLDDVPKTRTREIPERIDETVMETSVPFEYRPGPVEEFVTTPSSWAMLPAMVSGNPAWFIPNVGSAVNSAAQYIKSKLPTGVEKFIPETGDPWDFVTEVVDTGDWKYLVPFSGKEKDMARNPEDYAE